MFSNHRTVIALLLVLSAFLPSVRAQSPSAPTPFGHYTVETLRTELTKLGHEARIEGDVMILAVKREGSTLDLVVAMDRDLIYLTMKLIGPFKDPSALPAATLKKLLEENDTISPTHFALDPKNRLRLNRYVDNRERTTAAWRRLVEDLTAVALRTAPVWASKEMLALDTPDVPEGAASPASPEPAASPAPAASASPGK